MDNIAVISIVLLGAANLIVFLFVFNAMFDEDNGRLPYIFCQRYLWEILDDININFVGKFILCALFTPLTIFYMTLTIVIKVVCFIAVSAWELFCLLFQKKQ